MAKPKTTEQRGMADKMVDLNKGLEVCTHYGSGDNATLGTCTQITGQMTMQH